MCVEELTARDVMSRMLVVVKPEESVLMAWELMRRAGTHHLPVVRDGHLLGLLTRADVAGSWYGGPDVQSSRQVGTLVSRRKTPHAALEDPLPKLAVAMLDGETDALPVVTEGRLVGLVTWVDLLRGLAGRTSAQDEEGELVTGMFRLEPVIPT